LPFDLKGLLASLARLIPLAGSFISIRSGPCKRFLGCFELEEVELIHTVGDGAGAAAREPTVSTPGLPRVSERAPGLFGELLRPSPGA